MPRTKANREPKPVKKGYVRPKAPLGTPALPEVQGQFKNDVPPASNSQLEDADIDAIATGIVASEKARWETATAFITDRVSFKMRQLIRILRKNYYGIFDQPIDPLTQVEKVWYPLTEINVEAVVKNIDLDQKDINFRSYTQDGYEVTDVTRAHVKRKLSEMDFGAKLDDFERMLAIDGTAVWKTYEEYGKMQMRMVDLLNIYLDPTTPNIQGAYRFTERSLMFPEEIAAMNGWRNNKDIVPVEGLPRTDPYWMNRATMVNSNVKEVDVYELWGKVPEMLLTGDANDTQEVEGHLVVSGIDGGTRRCHLIERNTKQDREGNFIKPYEECWYTKVPNRWYGRGIAEKLLTLQIYANITFNVRINRSRISQLGLFKVRKGAGITPQMLARLPSNGAVVLNNLDDIEQFQIQEMGATSYQDEGVINTLSERLTNAFEVVTGEALPSSTPATNAAIQNQNAKGGFAIVKDAIGSFLERWMTRHALPILAKELTVGEVVRIEASDDAYKALIEKVVAYKAQEALDIHYAHGYVPSPQELQQEMQNYQEKLTKSDLFIKLMRSVVASQLYTEMYVTNEEMDVPTTVQNLVNMMSIAPEYRDDMVKQTFDLLGLGQPKVNPQQQGQPQGGLAQPGQQGGPQGNPLQMLQQQGSATGGRPAFQTQPNFTRSQGQANGVRTG